MMENSAVVGLVVLSAAAAIALFLVSRRRPSSGSPAPPMTTDKVLHPISWRSLRIESVTRVSPAVRLIRVALPKPSDTLDLPIGRHISVRVELPSGQAVTRPYTPVSPPWAAGYFDLLVKHYDGGAVSSHVVGLVPGDSLSLRGPVGNLRWVPSEHPRILLLAAGTGITPMLQLMRCILEARCDGGDATAVDLLFQNRTGADVLLRGDIDACVARRPDSFTAQACVSPPPPVLLSVTHPPSLRVQYFLSRPPPGWGTQGSLISRPGSAAVTQVEGYISAAHVTDALVRGPGKVSRVFVCGPESFCGAMTALAVTAGVDEATIKVL